MEEFIMDDKDIEKIFGGRFENNSDKKSKLSETIKKIESYGAKYDPNCFGGSAEEQLLVCETIAEVEQEEQKQNKRKEINDSVNVNGNDSCKLQVDLELTHSKLRVITDLKSCNYRTSPKKIAPLLEKLFQDWPSFSGHWNYISEKYHPKTINSVISRLIKIHKNGYHIDNPPGLFTEMIKHRKKRKGVYKYQ